MSEITPALSAEEWTEREFEASYGVTTSSVHVDHKGRLFAHSDDECTIVFNEASDHAPLYKTIALCNGGLDDEDPRKLTWAMVDVLRAEANFLMDNMPEEYWSRERALDARLIERVADILASYLPPR